MKFKAISDIGKKRDNNEDRYYASEDLQYPLFIVADGIGGNNFGEVASEMAVNIIKNEIKTIDKYPKLRDLEKDFIRAISNANKEVLNISQDKPELMNMGTTVTMMYRYNDCILIGNVGDSRAYSISENEIRQLTEDDTMVNSLLKAGLITQDQAINHPKRNIITNAVGTDLNIDINLVQYNFNLGEHILLCSDGLTDMLKDDEILGIFNKHDNMDDIANELLNKSLEAGGRDNITFIIIEL